MIIGITGYKGSGKSAVAAALRARGFHRLRMAGIIKDMLRVLGLTVAQVDGDEKETPCDLLGGKTPRWAMQSLGTEWGRNLVVEDLWVRSMRHHLGELVTKRGHSVVIDDIRFPNEAALVREFSGEMWRVVRAGLFVPVDAHPSERGIPLLKVDWEINNDGTLEDLQAQARRMIDRWQAA